MHAVALAADPPILYLRPTTLAVIEAVGAMRAGGAQAFVTLDAGPNPVVLCSAAIVSRVEMRVSALPGVRRSLVAGPGGGVERIERHLF
jgi:diphosphomevalonate decarboxylase